MDIKFERDTCIENMAETLFMRMQRLIKSDQQLNALAICEEWLVDGKDPQDEDTEFIFVPNLTV